MWTQEPRWDCGLWLRPYEARGAGTVEDGSGVIGSGEGMTNNLAEFAALYEGLSAFSTKHWGR